MAELRKLRAKYTRQAKQLDDDPEGLEKPSAQPSAAAAAGSDYSSIVAKVVPATFDHARMLAHLRTLPPGRKYRELTRLPDAWRYAFEAALNQEKKEAQAAAAAAAAAREAAAAAAAAAEAASSSQDHQGGGWTPRPTTPAAGRPRSGGGQRVCNGGARAATPRGLGPPPPSTETATPLVLEAEVAAPCTPPPQGVARSSTPAAAEPPLPPAPLVEPPVLAAPRGLAAILAGAQEEAARRRKVAGARPRTPKSARGPRRGSSTPVGMRQKETYSSAAAPKSARGLPPHIQTIIQELEDLKASQQQVDAEEAAAGVGRPASARAGVSCRPASAAGCHTPRPPSGRVPEKRRPTSAPSGAVQRPGSAPAGHRGRGFHTKAPPRDAEALEGAPLAVTATAIPLAAASPRVAASPQEEWREGPKRAAEAAEAAMRDRRMDEALFWMARNAESSFNRTLPFYPAGFVRKSTYGDEFRDYELPKETWGAVRSANKKLYPDGRFVPTLL